MKKTVEVTLPSDVEIQISRDFDAPRELVYRCYTEPALIRKWMSGPPGWAFDICEVDLRVGGAYRYVWGHVDGSRMGMQGVFREIKPAQKLADRQWYEGYESQQALSEVTFTPNGSHTRVVTLLTYPSIQSRDAALKTGMSEGMGMSFNALEDLLNTLSHNKE